MRGGTFRIKHSRMDEVKFVEDSLEKILKDMVCLSLQISKPVFHKFLVFLAFIFLLLNFYTFRKITNTKI